jgi:hypothetical protein
MGEGGVCLESKKLKKDSASNVAEAIMSRNSGRRRWICSPFIAHIRVTISDKYQMLQAGSSNKKYDSPN